MLERFSDQACRVVVRARDEARALNHSWIGTEHLMLALIGEGSGMAAQVLESLGISLEATRWLVEVIIGRVEQAPSGQLQFTPRAAKVLELASGLSHGYDHVGSWHILLGLLREGDGVGAMVLVTLGADQNRVGLRVTQLLNMDRGEEVPGEGSGLDERARARLLDNPLARIDALDLRRASVERSLSLHPDPGDLDQQTVTVRRETAATVDMQEFEAATELRLYQPRRPELPSPSAVAIGAGHCWPVAGGQGAGQGVRRA
jgi:ATP-dependent Clp protease ATP-binding subunit ClpA